MPLMAINVQRLCGTDLRTSPIFLIAQSICAIAFESLGDARRHSAATGTMVGFRDRAAQRWIDFQRFVVRARIDQFVGVVIHFVAAFGTDHFVFGHSQAPF
jgi:hypothetical protein